MPQPYSMMQDAWQKNAARIGNVLQGIGTDAATAVRLAGIHTTWPQLNAGVKLSFAQAGLDQNHPVVQQAAKLSTQQALNKQEWQQTFRGLKTIKDIQDLPPEVSKRMTPQQSQQVLHRANALLSGGSGDVLSPVTNAVGDVASKGLNVIGNTPVGQAVQAALPGGDVSNLVHQGIQQVPVVGKYFDPAVRTANLALQTPLQEVQGNIRATADWVSKLAHGDQDPFSNNAPFATTESQTQAGQAVLALQSGQPVDVGAGLMPSPQSATGQAAAQAARNAAPTIAGHAFTLGRFAAQQAGGAIDNITGTQIFQPNGLAFNTLSGTVDAGVTVTGDPSVYLLGGLGHSDNAFVPETANRGVYTAEDVNRANALADNNGLVPTATPPDIMQGTKSAWLQSPAFDKKVIQPVQGMTSPSEVLRYFDGSITADQAGQLAKANTPDQITQAFQGWTMPTQPTTGGFMYRARNIIDSKYLTAMPNTTRVDLTDAEGTWPILDKTLTAAGMNTADRNVVLDKYLQSVTDGNTMDGLKAIKDGVRQMVLATNPNHPEFADKFAQGWLDHEHQNSLYQVDQQTGAELDRPGVVNSGHVHVYPNPTLDSQRLNSTVQLPSARALRQLTGQWSTLLEHPVVAGGDRFPGLEGVMDGINNTWKSSVVVRPALLTKVTLEQQANAAARGMINGFQNPIGMLSMMVGDNLDTKVGQFLANHTPIRPSYMFDLAGAPFAETTDNLQHSLRYLGSPDTISAFGWHSTPVADPRAGEGLAEQLGYLHSDPVARGILDHTDPQAAKDWFWGKTADGTPLPDQSGAAIRLRRAQLTASDDAYHLEGIQAGKYGPDANANIIGDLANDRQASDQYLEKVYFPYINDMTGGGHPELLNAIKTGRLGGNDVYDWNFGGNGPGVVNQQAADYAKGLLDQGHGPPNFVPVRDELKLPAQQGGKVGQFYKSMIDLAFNKLFDAPNTALNVSPVYRQQYWDRVSQMLPWIKPDELPTALENAQGANLPDKLLSKLQNTALDTTDTPKLALDDIHQAAKAAVTGNDLPKIMHDLTSRTNFMDALRFMVPFGDAWRLVLTRAAQLVQDEPQVLERVRSGVAGLTATGSQTINRLAGDAAAPGQGFWHKDPQTGELVYTIPGSSVVTHNLFGVPIPLQGTVKGLSMLGDAYPGIGGPVVSLPAKWLLPNTPTGNQIKDVVYPYGNAASESIGQDIANTFVPTWATKMIQSYPNPQSYASAVNASMHTLASSGDYNLNDPADVQRLAHDSARTAKEVYTIRGFAQFLLPGTTAPQELAKDKTGKWVDAYAITKAYRKEQQKNGPDQAMQWLVDTMGVNGSFVAQPASAAVAYRVPVTKEGVNWLQAHPSVKENFPLTAGYFAPPGGPNAKLDPNAYAETFNTGQRTSLNIETQIAQAENRIGFYAYDRKKAQTLQQNGGRPLSTAQQQWFNQYKATLKEAFPGFDSFTADPYDTQKRRAQAITELDNAAADPALGKTDAGQGLNAYLYARDSAMAEQKNAGLSTTGVSTAKKALPLRAYLRDQANKVIAAHPNFKPMWDDIFSREVGDN